MLTRTNQHWQWGLSNWHYTFAKYTHVSKIVTYSLQVGGGGGAVPHKQNTGHVTKLEIESECETALLLLLLLLLLLSYLFK